ncbi:MAG TPA: GlsB/YeaQ/YmgE family stress response membrane protein [Candidatus Limnocylindrales bacterium]|nr:GlsB/YeaQ/YmgE family stress response membrane protein [Candidatus Limnocylindrales bacterium]
MDMNLIGWLVIGFLAGSISGWFVSDRSARGCLPTIVVGVVGGVVGGWLSREMGLGQVQGFIAALAVATVGAILVRLVLRALEGTR